jgi:hypothetical protein
MNDNFQHFENFRRERNRRRLEGGPRRDLGDSGNVLRQIEAAEQREVRDQQLTREVHEFFAAATKQAASIVQNVTEGAEAELTASVGREMSEFLRDTIRRAQEFMTVVQEEARRGVGKKDLEPHMQNIVGPVLDGFRCAGSPATAEQHLGQDPFSTELAGIESSVLADLPPLRAPQVQVDEDVELPPAQNPFASLEPRPLRLALPQAPSLVEDLPKETVRDVEPTSVATLDGDPLQGWFRKLAGDHERVKDALRVLVRASLMTKDEARAIWLATTS